MNIGIVQQYDFELSLNKCTLIYPEPKKRGKKSVSVCVHLSVRYSYAQTHRNSETYRSNNNKLILKKCILDQMV